MPSSRRHRARPKVRRTLLVVAVASLAVLAGCAGTVSRPVAESARDTSGRHDGLWTATVKSPGGRQNIERWVFDCGAQDFAVPLSVDDGRIFVRSGIWQEATRDEPVYIDESGRFRMEIPSENVARAGPGSDSQMSDGRVTYILQGRLDEEEPRGLFVYGVRQFVDRGCTYRVDFARVGD